MHSVGVARTTGPRSKLMRPLEKAVLLLLLNMISNCYTALGLACSKCHQISRVLGTHQSSTLFPAPWRQRRRTFLAAFPRETIWGKRSRPGYVTERRDLMSSLTKTRIRRMRLLDMRMELSFRGLDTKGSRVVLMGRLLDSLDKSDNSDNGGSMKQAKSDINPDRLYVLRTKGHNTNYSAGSGVGLVLYDSTNDKEVWSGGLYLRGDRSAFEADYSAIILGTEYVLDNFGLTKLVVQNPNDAIIQQLRGVYQVNKPELRLLYDIQKGLEDRFKDIMVETVPSTENIEANNIASTALSTQKSVDMKLAKGVKDPIYRIPAVPTSKGQPSTSKIEQTESLLIDQPNTEPVHQHLGISNDPADEAFTNFPPVDESVGKVDESHTDEVFTNFPAFEEAPGDIEQPMVIDPSREYLLRFDGGSRGNPGLAGSGMVIYDDQGIEVWNGWKCHTEDETNNAAEYYGLLLGLQEAKKLGISRLIVEGDSQLVVKQLNGEYKVKNWNLRKLFEKAVSEAKGLDYLEIRHIRRSENKRADELANQAMDVSIRGILMFARRSILSFFLANGLVGGLSWTVSS